MNEGLLAKREAWEDEASCKNMKPEIFFDRISEQSARLICSGCEVREECLEFALKHNIQYGIWGGLDEKERKELRRRMQRKHNQQRISA